MGEDPTLQVLQLRPRLDPELVDQASPCVGICLERVCLAGGAIVRKHQQAP